MAPPTITIEAVLSREGLLEVREAIDALLAELGAEPDTPYLAKLRERNAERKVAEVWGRVGKNTRRFLATAAALTQGDSEEFTMDMVATALELSPKTVRSWHRNLGRTLKQVEEVIPEPPFMRRRSDGQQNLYRFPREVREAILTRDRPPPTWE